MSTNEHLAESALRLPFRERAHLAARLLESLEDGDSDEDSAACWETEIVGRLERLAGGKASTITAEQAFREARARLASRR
jgi:putative addiction module component (TIGR02574 family)